MNRQLSVFNFSLTNKKDDEIDIHIDGYIVDAPTQEVLKAYWGDETSVSYKSFRNQIEAAKPKVINVFINSGGGHVGDAMAMHDYLNAKESDGVTVNRNGIGIVASAATYILMGKNSAMTTNSWFMIHNVQGGIWGDVNVIENYAKTMRKFNNQVRDFYSNATGLEPEQVSALMNKESWLTAQEAKDKGFVKNVTGEVKFSNSIKPEQWQFQNTAVLNAYNSAALNNSSTQNNNTQMETNKITEAIQNGFKNLKEALGIKDKDNNEAVNNAFQGFAESITNAIKDSGVSVTDEKLTEIVNTVLASDTVKNALALQVKNAVAENETVKGIPTNETISAQVKNELKTTLETFKNDLTTSISDMIGGGNGNKGGAGGSGTGGSGTTENKGNKTGAVKNSRFSNVNWNEN